MGVKMEKFKEGLEKLENRINELTEIGERIKYTISHKKGTTDYESYIEKYVSGAYDIKLILDMLYINSFINKNYYDYCTDKIHKGCPTEPE